MSKVMKIYLHIFAISLEKHGEMKLIFWLQINAKLFYKLIAFLHISGDRYAQSTQNNKVTIPLQYLKKNRKDKVDFLPADKHQRFLQIATFILGVCVHFALSKERSQWSN